MPQQNSTPGLELPTCDDRLLWDIWMSTGHMPTLTVADELGLFSLLDRTQPGFEGAKWVYSPPYRASCCRAGACWCRTASGRASREQGGL